MTLWRGIIIRNGQVEMDYSCYLNYLDFEAAEGSSAIDSLPAVVFYNSGIYRWVAVAAGLDTCS